MSAGRGCFSIFGMVMLFFITFSIVAALAGSAAARIMPLALMMLIAFLLLKIVGGKFEQITGGTKRQAKAAPVEARAAQSRDARVKQIKKAIPASEPIRATLITVVEEAVALRGMADRIASYPFAEAGVARSLHPDELRRKSDDAIAVTLDLTGRLQIILENTRGRPRSQRASAAMTAQHVRMEHLRDALIYSRDAIEEMILTHGETPGATDRLSTGLRNLTDAIDESYADPLDTRIAALASG